MIEPIKQFFRRLLGEEGVLITHRFRSRLAAAWYGYPGRRLKVIGVTGTNGKTTTCFLIAHILQAAGHRVGMATTVEFLVGGRRIPNTTKMTTMSPYALQRLLRQMADAGAEYAVMEVTSHAIKQERIFGIPFDVAVFTNLTHDHLDYHETFEEYREVKLRLFAGLPGQSHPRASVVNTDDKSGHQFLQFPADLKLTYGTDVAANVRATNIRFSPRGTELRVISPGGSTIELTLPLPGRFNVYNALAAMTATLACGVKLATAVQAVEGFGGVPGRMEKIDTRQPFLVLVDYAHTPDAFQQIYATIRPGLSGKIIHVFGATGDRDKTKRPILGAIAAKHADYIILTDEDPYSEDPKKIIDEVAEGVIRAGRGVGRMKESKQFWKVLDRRRAIAQGLSLADRGDIVLITGKGAEQAMVVGAKHVPWDERKIVREELAKLGYKG